jgi:lipopolysaccharide export system protein LptA
MLWLTLACLSVAHADPISTNIVITSDGGGEFDLGTGLVHYRSAVRVVDPTGFVLTCEDLLANLPSDQGRLQSIVATTNVVIEITRPASKPGEAPSQIKATSDRAVYTATNDLITLDGNARVEFPQGILASDEPILYDRTSGNVRSTGRWKTTLKPGALKQPGLLSPKSTNAPADSK